jgi:hypothetical protein
MVTRKALTNPCLRNLECTYGSLVLIRQWTAWHFEHTAVHHLLSRYNVLWRLHQQQNAQEAALLGSSIAIHQKIHAAVEHFQADGPHGRSYNAAVIVDEATIDCDHSTK